MILAWASPFKKKKWLLTQVYFSGLADTQYRC